MPILSTFFGSIVRMWHDDHPRSKSVGPTRMIKLLALRYLGSYRYFLESSDGGAGIFDLGDYRSGRQGPLLAVLDDETLASRAFIDAGAMCWPRGLELSARRSHELSIMQAAA
jgi:hypothetical protein